MLLPIFKQFNWIDIFVIILFFRISYIGIKAGFPAELFKLAGTLAAIYFSLHYFTLCSDFLVQRLGLKETLPLEFLDFLMFVLLAALGYGIFIVLRLVFGHWMKMEAVPHLNKWGGCIVGILRGILLSGLLVFGMSISTVSYVQNSVNQSYSGKRLSAIAPAAYRWIWDHLMSKFMFGEKPNETISEIQNKTSE